MLNQNDLNRKFIYLNDKKLQPQLRPLRPPYPTDIDSNIYITMSELINRITPIIRSYPRQYIQDNIFDIFKKVMNFFNLSKKKILIIDTRRYKIYQNLTAQNYNSDLINALLTAYIYSGDKIKPLDFIIIFRTPEADWKMDLAMFERRDIQRMKHMLEVIGTPADTSATTNEEAGESSDSFTNDEEEIVDVDDIDNDKEDVDVDDVEIGLDADNQIKKNIDNELKSINQSSDSAIKSIKNSLSMLSDQYGKVTTDNDGDVEDNTKDLYQVKTIDINASLLQRITPSTSVVDNYKTISSEITSDNNPVEKDIVDNAVKKMGDVAPTNTETVLNATSSAREQKIREQVGRVKLNNVTFNTLTSITDVPKPQPLQPRNITTTNSAAIKGSQFAFTTKEYEDKLLDRDIVATFMNFSKLPDGFYVTTVEVTDVSTVTSLVNNWKVTLKNKQNDRQSVINIRVPKVFNGRFYNNGIWYNIGKQDFPIPVLKINSKTVMLTSNYNKITCSRYDTRSLVDLGMLMKVIDKYTDESGKNKYMKAGCSTNTNSRFVSTIEYDEYAKRWLYFKNKEANMELYFNRVQCEKLYSFVTVNENEFCCGMINQVPVVINTETGLTRNNITLTDTILEYLPEEIRNNYKKQKHGKMSMYAEITIGVSIPLGVAIAAWEGLTNLLKKSKAKYQFVDSKFDDIHYFTIPFKDKILAIESTTVNQLIFNGFYRINTKAYSTSDFEIPIMQSNSVFVDICNQLFFKQYSQLTIFITYYNFFVDAITGDVCRHYNIPDDISGMLVYAANMLADNNFTGESNAALYRVRSSEIIPAMIHYHLAVAISKYNNNVGSKTRGNSIAFNPNAIINELLAQPTVEPASALNPMIEMHSKETISKKGFRGVNTDRSYTPAKRSHEESMIGKIAMSSPNSANVGVSRQLTADPKLESVRGYTSTAGIESDFNDLQLASFSELLTPGTVTRDDAIRLAIGTSQTSHIISTDAAQPVLISNGVDEIVPAYLSEEFSYVAREDGTVLDLNEDFMIIQYKSGKKKAINIAHKQSFNSGSGFYVDNKLIANFKAKERFRKGDVLAYHERFFSKDSDGVVRMNVGPIAKVAFAGLYSTYEDAGLVTTKMSKKLATKLTLMQQTKINAMDDIESIIKVGTEVEIGDPLIVFGIGDTGDKSVDNFLKAFQEPGDENSKQSMLDSAKRVIKSENAGKVVDVRMYTCKSMDRLSPSLFKIFDTYFKDNLQKRKILDKYDKTDSVYKLDTLYSLPTEPLKGSTIKGITCDVLIEIYIEHEDEAGVGDKLAMYGASKQVLSEVIPEGLEPYTESRPDEEVSLFVAPSCILKRMIPSLLISASGNKVLIELKRKMKQIWESK